MSQLEKVEIRTADPSEYDDIGDLLALAYNEHFPPEPWPQAWRGYAEELRDVRRRLDMSELLVAVHDGTIKGTVTYFPPSEEPKSEGFPGGWAAFRLLGIHPEARGRGIGRMLATICIDRARSDGAPVLALHTTEIMAVARAMYQRMGWVRAPAYDFVPTEGLLVEAYTFDL